MKSRVRKFFNCAGPCILEDHYMIDPKERLGNIRQLIDEKRYFILHSPRQTGKTTNMGLLADQLNEEGEYIALYANIEGAQAWRNQVERVNKLIIHNFKSEAKFQLPPEYHPSSDCFDPDFVEEGVRHFLTTWCLELPKPLVLFIDEIDALIGDSLISVLRQLRSGYKNRPRGFPHALCLIGLRDVRDYRIFSDETQKYVVGGSAFNIKEESLRLAYFTLDQVQRLYQQHTEETGQKFTSAALEKVYESTQGQPWLVNAIGRELCFGKHALPHDQEVMIEDVDNAIEILILRRDVHLDQLADKLMEPKVMRMIQQIMLGEELTMNQKSILEDKQYLLDLGLVKEGRQGLEIANAIYREVIPRELTSADQSMLAQDPAWYVTPEGKLNLPKFIKAFVEFYKENHEMITQRKTYNEAAHHLIFMAWLHRIVNSGGRVQREYALGLKRVDLCVSFGGERHVFELKLSGGPLHKEKTLNAGKEQLVGYLQRLSLDEGWLVLFQRGKIENIDKLGKEETIQYKNKTIHILSF